MSLKIIANNYGLVLPEGCQLAIVKSGQIIDQGQHIADEVFNAAGQVYLDAMDKYIDSNIIKDISKRA